MINDTVLRVKRDRNYKTLHCAVLDDATLSWRAKGLMFYLMSRPDGWKFRRAAIDAASTEGREAVTTALNELKKAGYLQIVMLQEGTVGQWQWTVREMASQQDVLPLTAFPCMGSPMVDKSAPNITTCTNDLGNNSIEQVNKLQAPTAPVVVQDTVEHVAQAPAPGPVTDRSEPPVAPPPFDQRNADIMAVFTHWQLTLGYGDRKLTQQRRAHINARLNDGFTVQQLCQVHEYAKQDDFLQGKNDRNTKFDDILNLYRNAGRIERYLTALRDIRRSPNLTAKDTPGVGRRF